jgi:hypothetical protein
MLTHHVRYFLLHLTDGKYFRKKRGAAGQDLGRRWAGFLDWFLTFSLDLPHLTQPF